MKKQLVTLNINGEDMDLRIAPTDVLADVLRKEVTGISSPFEIPEQPDLTIDTSTQSLEESVAILKKTVFPRIVSFNI